MPRRAILKSSKKRRKTAFTLIELLVVIAILGILAAAVLVAINPFKRTAQARDAQRKSNIQSIANASQAYSVDKIGVYPGVLGQTDCGPSTQYFTDIKNSGGLKTIPDDPQSGKDYCAYPFTHPISLQMEVVLWATLESPVNSGNVVWCWRSSDNSLRERPLFATICQLN